jgi:glycosyltransferase involved in cell wall biosynthesis
VALVGNLQSAAKGVIEGGHQGHGIMRICLYTNTALPKVGGQEIVIDALARQFLALGHEPVVLAPWRESQGPFDAASVPYPVVWHPRFFSTYWFVSWYGRWMAKLHHTRRFDVIHCQGTYPAGYVGACCKAVQHLPLVITSHGDDLAPLGLYDRKPKLRGRFRMALAQADAVVAISDYTARMFREACPELRQIVPIPNGVDVEQFAAPVPRPANIAASIRPRSYLLFLGRLDPRKGIDVLLEAMVLLRGRCDCDLVVAGRGPEGPSLQALTARLGLQRQVHFVGQTTGQQKLWLLQNGLCTIVPSRIWEAFGVVAVESLAAGRPVIASQLPGLADLVQPGRTGLLVPPESPQRLAEAIREVVRDPLRADGWGNTARRFVRAFDWRNIARRHLDLFAELIAIKRCRATPYRPVGAPAGNCEWPTAAHARPPISLTRPPISADD